MASLTQLNDSISNANCVVGDTSDASLDDIRTLLGSGNTWASVTTSSPTTSHSWTEVESPESMTFKVDGEIIEFTGTEIIRLKEMLHGWIEDYHPEDLL